MVLLKDVSISCDVLYLLRKEGNIWKISNTYVQSVGMNIMNLISFKQQVVTLQRFLMYKIRNSSQSVVADVGIPSFTKPSLAMDGIS